MLGLILRIFFGPLREPAGHDPAPVRDLAPREVLALAPLVAVILWIGIQPGFFLDRMTPTFDRLTAGVIEKERLSPEGTAEGRVPRLCQPCCGTAGTIRTADTAVAPHKSPSS